MLALACALTSCLDLGDIIGQEHVHDYTLKKAEAAYLASEATCESAATYYYSCVCGEKSDETFKVGTRLSHTYDQKNTDAAYLKSEATCKNAATYHYSCVCGAKGSKTFTSGAKKEHVYTSSSVVAATCKSGGYTLHTCECGHSYKDNLTSKSYNHDFALGRAQQGGLSFDAFVCTKCSLAAIAYGNADGSFGTASNKVKYYVTGDIVNSRNYEIVIFGNGNMPDFSASSRPVWQEYLLSAKKIVIADGVTTIGSYAFYEPQSSQKVEYSISDTVKTVKPYALGMKTTSITLGKSVTRIEDRGIVYQNVSGSVYLPSPLTYMGELAGNVTYFYEGSLQELYAISTNVRNQICTVQDAMSEWDNPGSVFSFYVNAESITDRSDYWR